MKIVLSGGTGYIGSEVLAHALNHPAVTSVIILTRRDLPQSITTNPKAQVIHVKDFTSYDTPTTNAIKDSDAALWCLGTYDGNEKVDIDFPLTFINTIKSRPATKPFRFIQLSGAFTEPPPKAGESERSLWYFAGGRRVRGKAEAVIAAEDDSSKQFTVHVVKPAAVLPSSAKFLHAILPAAMFTNIGDVGATMVDLAVNGAEQKIFSAPDTYRYARKLEKKAA